MVSIKSTSGNLRSYRESFSVFKKGIQKLGIQRQRTFFIFPLVKTGIAFGEDRHWWYLITADLSKNASGLPLTSVPYGEIFPF